MLTVKLIDYLAAQGIVTAGTNGFVEFLPDTPDNVVVLYSTGGFGFDFNPVLGYDNVTIQVRVRNTNQLAAYNKIISIYDELQGLGNIDLDGTHVVSIAALQSAPANIGRDKSNRPEYTINFAIEVRNATTHRE